MSVAMRKPSATAESLLDVSDGRALEVVDGALVEKAAPSAEHSYAQFSLSRHLWSHFNVRDGGREPGGWWILGEVDVELESHEVYRPDVVGWRRERIPERPRGRPVRLRPDWICEVLSASNAKTDLVAKFPVLQRCGIPHYWIVDPEREVLTVHRWTEQGYLVALQATRG
jgi:Uma2 family endonuclease